MVTIQDLVHLEAQGFKKRWDKAVSEVIAESSAGFEEKFTGFIENCAGVPSGMLTKDNLSDIAQHWFRKGMGVEINMDTVQARLARALEDVRAGNRIIARLCAERDALRVEVGGLCAQVKALRSQLDIAMEDAGDIENKEVFEEDRPEPVPELPVVENLKVEVSPKEEVKESTKEVETPEVSGDEKESTISVGDRFVRGKDTLVVDSVGERTAKVHIEGRKRSYPFLLKKLQAMPRAD